MSPHNRALFHYTLLQSYPVRSKYTIFFNVDPHLKPTPPYDIKWRGGKNHCNFEHLLSEIFCMLLSPPPKKKTNKMDTLKSVHTYIFQLHRVSRPKNGTVDLLGLCSDQQLSFFTLLDRASFPYYNNTKISKFG